MERRKLPYRQKEKNKEEESQFAVQQAEKHNEHNCLLESYLVEGNLYHWCFLREGRRGWKRKGDVIFCPVVP